MPAKPTPKLRALGVALRKAREDKQLGIRELARRMGDEKEAGALSRYERGERAAPPEKIAQILATLGVNGPAYDSIMALTRDSESPLWVAVTLGERQHQMEALLDFEDTASQITTVSPLLVPGLLQTEEYTQAMMSADDEVPANEIRTRVAVRMGRRTILTRRSPVPLLAMVSESVLDQLIGTPEVMAGQLRAFLEMGERDNVTIRVVPKMSGWSPALEGMFHLVESDPMPIVHLENRRSGWFLHEEADLELYRRAVERISRVALSPEESAGLIAEYLTRWENRQ